MSIQKSIPILLLLLLASAVCSAQPTPSALAHEYHIEAFGAVGDSITLNTQAIQAAIDTAAAEGGGKVIVPPGQFMTGSLFLKDNVELHLMAGATLLGSVHKKDYQWITDEKAYGAKGGPAAAVSGIIMGNQVNNISVTGSGIINGQGGKGEDFRAYPLTDDGSKWHKPPRPKTIMLYYCTNVRIEDITSYAPQEWAQHYLGCDFMNIRGVKIHAHDNANGDGIDLDGCQDVVMSDCILDTDDNAFILKGRGARDCINITVQNCIFASKITAIKTGTESSGGFKNIVINNCVVRSSYEPKHFDKFRQQMNGSGIALEITDGGTMDGVIISNIVMEECYAPFFIKLGDRGRLYKDGVNTPPPGKMKNIKIQNIICKKTSNRYTSTITGFPGHYIENLTLQNIHIEHEGGIKASDVFSDLPENSSHHPWPGMFKRDANYPAYALYLRHVKNLTLDNITTTLDQPDERPAVYMEDVQNERLRFLDFDPKGAKKQIVHKP
ncbi:glycoside hydrolase family 28 protein [Phaeodactylibacter xiamenensis]|uniref:glycoside hydrolase family 28 protein n=1 Tax=Phaeodactylibacter xiamenensis TaxID=1524460 RepID=UPI003CCBB49B